MKAKQQIWCEGDRVELAAALPLETPISVSFEASSICNLKCNFCVHGLKDKPFVQKLMDFEIFKRAADSLKKFPSQIKDIVFTMAGEPTLNPELPQMVKYLNDLNIAKQITTFTNGIRLTPELGRRLIDAGLTRLRVSIEGLNDERYQELCGVKASYRGIVDNIAAFYEYKSTKQKNCHVFVKTFSQSLTSGGGGSSIMTLVTSVTR